MRRTQKWICDEAVTWWAAYTRNKPAPPRYCSSPLHVSICMANSHTGGCMRPQGLIHDRLGLSNVCFQTLRCSPLLVCCASLHLGWSIHSPASLLLLWPCDPPPPRPLQRVHSTSQHCSSTYHFLVSSYFYFLFSFVQCKNSSGHLQTLFPSHTDWFELVELNLHAHRAPASSNSLVSLFLIARWHKYQLEGLMYDERAHPSAWLLCVVISFPTGMFLHFVLEQNCVKLK